MFFQIGHILLDALLKMSERKEVDGVDGNLVGFRVAFLEHTLDVRGRSAEHTAVGVVDDGDFVGVDELLGNNNRAEGFLTIGSGSKVLGNIRRSTYAAPPALRITCASPSLMPRAASGLVDPAQSVQLRGTRSTIAPTPYGNPCRLLQPTSSEGGLGAMPTGPGW